MTTPAPKIRSAKGKTPGSRKQRASAALGGLILAFGGVLLLFSGFFLLLPFSVGIVLAWTLPRRGLPSWVGPLFCLALASLLSTRFGLDSLETQKGAFLALWQSQMGWFVENWPRYVTDGPAGLHFGSIPAIWAYFLLIGLPVGSLVRKTRLIRVFFPGIPTLDPPQSSVSPTSTTPPPTGGSGIETTTDNGVEPTRAVEARYTVLHTLFTRAEAQRYTVLCEQGNKIRYWWKGMWIFGRVPPHLVPDTHLFRGIDRVFDDFHTRFWLSLPCKLRDTTPPSVYAPPTRLPGTHGKQVDSPLPCTAWDTGNRVPGADTGAYTPTVYTWGTIGQVGSVELLVAPEKSGKTKLTAGLTNAQRTGAPFLGWPTVQSGAVHLVEESATMYDPKRREAMGLPPAPIRVTDQLWRHRVDHWNPDVSRSDTTTTGRLPFPRDFDMNGLSKKPNTRYPVSHWLTRFWQLVYLLLQEPVLDKGAYDGGSGQGGKDETWRRMAHGSPVSGARPAWGWLSGIICIPKRHLREMWFPTLTGGIPPGSLPSNDTGASGASPQVVPSEKPDWYTRSCRAIGHLYRVSWKWARVLAVCLALPPFLARLIRDCPLWPWTRHSKHRDAGLPAEKRTQAKRIDAPPTLLAILYGPTPGLERALLPLTSHLAMACTIARIRSSLTGIPWYTIQIDSLFHWLPDAETDANHAMAALQLFKAVAACGFLVRVVVHATPTGNGSTPGKFRVSGPQNIPRQADVLCFLEPLPRSASPRDTTKRKLSFQGRFEQHPKPDDLSYDFDFHQGRLIPLLQEQLNPGTMRENRLSAKSSQHGDDDRDRDQKQPLAPTETTQPATGGATATKKEAARANLDLLLSLCPSSDQQPARAAVVVKQYQALKQVQRDRVYTMARDLEAQGTLAISFVPGTKLHQWQQASREPVPR